MTLDEVLSIFRDAGAIQEGHFILASGHHSPVFFQKTRVVSDAARNERLFRPLADIVRAEVTGTIDYVVGPAFEGIIPAYEAARHLAVPVTWLEREAGSLALRPVEIDKGSRVIVVEDVVTTGLAMRETVGWLQKHGIDVAAGACVIDCSGGKADVGAPLVSVAQYDVPAYPPDLVPAELASIPPVKAGQRNNGRDLHSRL